MNRISLALVLLLLIGCASVLAEEEKPKQNVYSAPDFGIQFNCPDDLKLEGDSIPVDFKYKGVTYKGDFRTIPGDINSLRDLVKFEMEEKGWKLASQMAYINETTHTLEYTFSKDKELCLFYLYSAQGGHRFFHFKCTGSDLKEKVQDIHLITLSVQIKDVLKDNPPNNPTMKNKTMGIEFSCPWYWGVRKTAGDLKFSFDVFFSQRYFNHVDIRYFPEKGGDLDTITKEWLKSKKAEERFTEIGNSPRKIGKLKGTELEYTYLSKKDKKEMRERVLFVLRNKDLFRISFITLSTSHLAGLKDYFEFFKSIKIDPREEEVEKEEDGDKKENGDKKKPE